MRSLRQYRLFVTLLVLPVLAIVLIVVLVMALTRGGEEDPAAATPSPTAAVGGLPTTPPAGRTPVASQITVAPTQPPVPEPTPTLAPTPTPTEPSAPTPTPTPTPEGPIEYAVQDGDTLFSIASAYGVSVSDLVNFNDLPDENFVLIGQVLEIPTDPAQVIERRESQPVATIAVVVPNDGLNVREAPNTATGTVQYVAPGGTELALTGVVEVIDGIEWREVTDGNWVQAQYLEIGVRAAPAQPAAPAATEAPAPAATEAPQPTQAPEGETVRATVVPTAGLNVRTTADPTGAVAYVAPGASELELTGETQVVDGVTWWQLTDGNWVQGQFLKFG